MDLRLTNNELEIKHATKEDIIELVTAIEKIICSKLNISYPMESNTVNEVQPLESLLDTSVEDLLDKPKTTFPKVENTLVDDILEVLNKPPVEPLKKKLVFDKCPKCGEVVYTMTYVKEGLAPTINCICGESFEAYELTKGNYTCDCGQKGFFLMRPQVATVTCKECKKEIYMVYSQEEGIYNGYLD